MENNSLQHHGILRQRWGFRRFQNKDGTLTEAGKARYRKKEASEQKKQETAEEKRSRLSTSTDAADILKNIDILSNDDLANAVKRINSKNTLADMAKKQNPTNLERAYKKIDSALTFGRKMNEIYEFTQKPMVKALTKGVMDRVGAEVNQATSNNANNKKKKK